MTMLGGVRNVTPPRLIHSPPARVQRRNVAAEGMFRRYVKKCGLKDFGLYDLKGKAATDMYRASFSMSPVTSMSRLFPVFAWRTLKTRISRPSFSTRSMLAGPSSKQSSGR